MIHILNIKQGAMYYSAEKVDCHAAHGINIGYK